jgi:trimeric autotransporter adhesin
MKCTVALATTLLVALVQTTGLSRSPQGMPDLRGSGAIDYLHENGLFGSIHGALESARYSIRPSEHDAGQTFTASNAAHHLRASFSPEGLELTGESWRAAWRLQSVDYGKHRVPVGLAQLAANGNRIELERSNVEVLEWFVNGAAGLEQGFTLKRQPGELTQGERLRLTIAVDGDLRPSVSGDGQEIQLWGTGNKPLLRYGHLLVTDAKGRRLPARMGVSQEEDHPRSVWLEVLDTNAEWPITIDPTFSQEAYLKASNTETGDRFSFIAISGDTVVIGAPFEDSNTTGVNGDGLNNLAPDAGAAYVFVRNGTLWSWQAYLKASNTEAGDQFGAAAISGDTVLIGAPGEDSNATGIGGDESNNLAADSGAVYVFVRSGTTWTQQAYLKASNTDADDLFGTVVAISGETAVVGAYSEDRAGKGVNPRESRKLAAESGAAYIFVRNGTTWTQQAYLKASNTDSNDVFGLSVAISGDTVVVGAPFEASGNGKQQNNSAFQAGAAYVFVRNGTIWTQQAYLKASNAEAGDTFAWGSGLAISGNTIVVGAVGEASNATGINGDQTNNLASSAGAAYVFERNGTTWTQQAYLKASNSQAGDRFGSVAISGDVIVVGAGLEASNSTGVDGDQANNSVPMAGAAYVFARSGAIWAQQAYLKASNTGAGDLFGGMVAISGTTVAVAARDEDSSATLVDGDGSDNSAADSGAVFVFTITP